MKLITQHQKKLMEECKIKAKDVGLLIDDETLEYEVTNQDMVELSPKGMIPTHYDYWVQDLEIIKGKKQYELYPHSAYETVINSRPAISFYNDNNPDWLNVMIFYHVIGHIDFFQNNMFYKNTWDDDFVGQALADKRLINHFRTKHGRWVDYIIEFTRGIDNITGYYHNLSSDKETKLNKIDYYFDIFLQKEKKCSIPIYLKEMDKYNKILNQNKRTVKTVFLAEVKTKYPEFEAFYKRYNKKDIKKHTDIIQYLMQNSDFVNRDENKWMKSVMEIVRNMALYFEPQRRTKVCNEGWASLWHDKLFRADDRISGHEVDYAVINSKVTSLPLVGLNPYALGMRLFEYIEECGDKGKLSKEFDLIKNRDIRKKYNKKVNNGKEKIFNIRKNLDDFNFINTFINQDFVDKHNLCVVGERIDKRRGVKQYYIKSRKAEDYKQYVMSNFIHPPHITVDTEKTKHGILRLTHHYEKKQLIPEFIYNTMVGIEYLWNGVVELDTNLVFQGKPQQTLYVMKNRELTK